MLSYNTVGRWVWNYSLIVVAYVIAIAALMLYSQNMFGQMKGVLSGIAFLLLFVISTAIIGFLIFGKPILMYLDNKKKEAIYLFTCTIGWLILFTFVAFMVVYLVYAG